MNGGRIEQVGTPREVYENPQTEFVFRFLGPVATLRGQLVRPHDLVLSRQYTPGAVTGKINRVTHLGFEVRVEIRTLDDEIVTAQVTRGEAWHLGLQAGDEVHVTAENSPRGRPRVPGGDGEAPDPIAVH
jgi:sulfate transport system ATP-binding protein